MALIQGNGLVLSWLWAITWTNVDQILQRHMAINENQVRVINIDGPLTQGDHL